MALQKKNPILRSHLVVAVFWFILLFFLTGKFSLGLLSQHLSYALMVVVIGVAMGVGTWAAIDFAKRSTIKENLARHTLRGAILSVGSIIVTRRPPSKSSGKVNPLTDTAWWSDYEKKHPEHAKAMIAILEVMLVSPKLPASPVLGGHGGLTLIQHSLNVVASINRMAKEWRYRGHKNKSGGISFPLIDSSKIEHKFNVDDPILPLVAFAHDIGKTICYRLEPNGTVSEVRKNHDIEGVKLLRAIPEVSKLPWRDRMPLLIACEYYHHIGTLPQATWIGDRARSLIELLIAADVDAGKREGGAVDSYDNSVESIDESLPVINEQSGGIFADTDASGTDGMSEMGAQATDTSAGLTGDASISVTHSLLLEPGRINGTNATTRIAWKNDGWLYINDARLRSAVAARFQDESYMALPSYGVMHSFTLSLMAELSAKGWLLQEHAGQKFTEKRAIFNTSSDVKGNTSVANKFILVVKVEAFPGTENIPDCRNKPIITGCSWGDNAAVGKGGGQAPAQAAEGAAGEAVLDSDEAHTESSDAVEDAVAPEMDIVSLLAIAARTLQIPFVERVIKGTPHYLFEETIVDEVFPGVNKESPGVCKITGQDSGKTFIGIEKK